MSMLAAILFAQASAAAPAPKPVDPAVTEQVREIGAKLHDWRGAWAVVDGQLGCRTVTSTEDEAIDLIGCAALIHCIKPIYPELRAIADGPGEEADKKRRFGEKLSSQSRCLTEQRGTGIAALALERAGK